MGVEPVYAAGRVDRVKGGHGAIAAEALTNHPNNTMPLMSQPPGVHVR
jgi:hypothetical protein